MTKDNKGDVEGDSDTNHQCEGRFNFSMAHDAVKKLSVIPFQKYNKLHSHTNIMWVKKCSNIKLFGIKKCTTFPGDQVSNSCYYKIYKYKQYKMQNSIILHSYVQKLLFGDFRRSFLGYFLHL